MSNYENRLNDNNLNLMNIMNTVSNLPDAGGGGTEDVKLFDSIANMQADPSPVENGLAVVYYGSIGNLTADTEFQVATFPETVTLPSAVTDYINIEFIAVDGSSFDCWGTLSSDSFNINIYGSGMYRIQYTSSDGINYTRTQISGPDGMVSGDDVDFGTIIKFGSNWGSPTWNDAIGYFIQVGTADFQGLYQYKNSSYSVAKTQLQATPKDVFSKTFYGSKGIEVGNLQNVVSNKISDITHRVSVYNAMYENITYTNSEDQYGTSRLFWNSKIEHIPSLTFTDSTYFDMCFSDSSVITIGNISIPNAKTVSSMFANCSNLVEIGNVNMPNVTSVDNMFINCTNLSMTTYANIANFLPNTTNLQTKTLHSLGLNSVNFSNDQLNILYNKGYADATPLDVVNWSNSYNVYYE